VHGRRFAFQAKESDIECAQLQAWHQ